MLEATCRRYRTGSLWRDLPAEFGPWKTVWKRHSCWSKDGNYRRMLGVVARLSVIEDDQVGLLAGMMSADPTIVRAHQHAAGARKGTEPGGYFRPPRGTGGTVE